MGRPMRHNTQSGTFGCWSLIAGTRWAPNPWLAPLTVKGTPLGPLVLWGNRRIVPSRFPVITSRPHGKLCSIIEETNDAPAVFGLRGDEPPDARNLKNKLWLS